MKTHLLLTRQLNNAQPGFVRGRMPACERTSRLPRGLRHALRMVIIVALAFCLHDHACAQQALTADKVAEYAYLAKFRGESLAQAVAVAWAESSFIPSATRRNVSQSGRVTTDRGLWQINDYWHSEVSGATAFNPRLAAVEVYRISRKGTDWHEWYGFGNANYRSYYPVAQQIATQVANRLVSQKNQQALSDVRTAASNDWRLGYVHADTLTLDETWSKDYDLRGVQVTWAWVKRNTVWQATRKTDPTVRLITYYDPNLGAMKPWQQIR